MAKQKLPMHERKCHIRACSNPPVGVFMFRQQLVPFCNTHKELADKDG